MVGVGVGLVLYIYSKTRILSNQFFVGCSVLNKIAILSDGGQRNGCVTRPSQNVDVVLFAIDFIAE